MPTRNISLISEQDAFIEEAAKAGEYQNASEAVREGLRAVQQRWRQDMLKLEALRRQIDAGIDALAHGEFTEVADAELEVYLDRLAARSGEQGRHSGGQQQTLEIRGEVAIRGPAPRRCAKSQPRPRVRQRDPARNCSPISAAFISDTREVQIQREG